MGRMDHQDIAEKNYNGLKGKASLSALFIGFSGLIPNPVFNSIMIYGGAVGLFLTDVLPNLFNQLSVDEKHNKLLVVINDLKKITAAVETGALAGVIVDRTVELFGFPETAEAITVKLVKAFISVLGAKGLLMLLTAIENGIREGVSLKTLRLSLLQGGLLLLQSGFLFASSLGKLTVQAASGYNIPTSVVQALDFGIAGIWHSYKGSTQQPAGEYHRLNS